MKIETNELINVLSQFNPWWRGAVIPDLPSWHRAVFNELHTWAINPPAPRAVLLSGARQVGKTTLLLQLVEKMLKDRVPPANILYATFDHPLIKLAGLERVLSAWREREPKVSGIEYLLLDEAHLIKDLGTWVKHQVDFDKTRRIVFTGSAMPLIHSQQESGVGRWHNIKLSTLSFYEYLQLKERNDRNEFQIYASRFNENNNNIGWPSNESNNNFFNQNLVNKWESIYSKDELPKLPSIRNLNELFQWEKNEFIKTSERALPYVGYLNEYLVRSGFPQTLQVKSVTQAQKLLREDIIDKVLKRDMTAIFGVRNVIELENTFLYLCLHEGGLLDIQTLCKNLEIGRGSVQNFIELLEASHLIYKLRPYGYGKEVLRAKYKIYLADAAIASAVLLRGKSILQNSTLMGTSIETAVFKHLYGRHYLQDIRFSYWKGKNNQEVDLIAQINEKIIPFEVKYKSQDVESRDIKGLLELCNDKVLDHSFIITKNIQDFGILETSKTNAKIMRIPALLFCYWMGESELSQEDPFG